MRSISLPSLKNLSFIVASAMLCLGIGTVLWPDAGGTTLVIIDAGVQDADIFAESVLPGTKVVMLDGSKSGMEQITEILAEESSIENLQIVSHGSAGRIFLGNSDIDKDMLLANATILKQWHASLTPSASIVLLGCDVALGKEGEDFVRTLASLTNADVSASSDLTGGFRTAGNWELEVHTGNTRPVLAFDASALASYSHTLNHFRYGTMSWSSTGSGRQVLIKVENVWTNNHSHISSSVEVGEVIQSNKLTSFTLGDGTNPNTYVRVTARDETNNDVTTELVSSDGEGGWISGIYHTYEEDGDYIVSWGGSTRETAKNHNGASDPWINRMVINIGDGNDSPVAAVPASIQVKDNEIFRYNLTATDPNGDAVEFRFGTQAEFYHATPSGARFTPTGLQMSETGAIVWDVRDSELSTVVGDRWQMTIMVEDLDSEGEVRSTIPVDFVFIISDKEPATFDEAPEETVNPTPGEPTEVDLEVNDPDYESCEEPSSPVISVLNPPSTDALVWATEQSADGSTTNITATFTPTEDMAGQSYVVVFRATTCSGATSERTVTFFVPGENQAPGNIALSKNWIVAPSLVEQQIGTLTVSDVDPGDSHVLTLTGATNTDLFDLSGISGSLLVINDPSLADPGTYTIRVRATDSGDLTFEKNFTIYILEDDDEDGVADSLPEEATYLGGTPPLDSLIGNRNYVTTTGTTDFAVRIDDEDAEGTYDEEKLTRFYDGASELLAFANDYTENVIRLANILIKRTINSLVVNMGDELPDGTLKTLYLDDNNFISLCVKDAAITSLAEISDGCDGEDEIDFTSCIGSADPVTIEGITCTDEGSRFKVEDLTHSGIMGTPAPTPTQSSNDDSGGNSGGGSGGSRRGFNPVTAWLENQKRTHAAAGDDPNGTGGSGSCPTKDLFRDVPEADWYAIHVCILKEAGVVSGYKDAQGNDLQRYIPGNNVTYAELAKIALLASGGNPNGNGKPRNPTAINDWSEPYIRTMEGLRIAKYPVTLNVHTPATRGDVIAVMLQMFDIQTTNHTSSPFTDLRISHPDANALLTAVDMGILQGDTNSDGDLLYTIRPDAPINRAETAKIFHLLLQEVDSH